MVCFFNRKLYLYLFDSPDHKFQWVGATSIIAIITLAVNAWDNRRKFKADLVSKSRLEWLARVEKITADLYTNYYQFIDDSYSYFSSQDLYKLYNGTLIKAEREYGAKGFTKDRVIEELSDLERVINKTYEAKTNHGDKFKQAYAELTMALFDTEKNEKLFEALDVFIKKVNKFDDTLDKKSEKIDINKLPVDNPKLIAELAGKIKASHLKIATEYRESKEITDVFDKIREHLHEQWELAKRGE